MTGGKPPQRLCRSGRHERPETTDRERWEAKVDRDLARIGAITAGLFAIPLSALALIMWWVRS